MANFCSRCGQEIQAGMSACPKCGAAVQTVPSANTAAKAKLDFANFVNIISIIMLVMFGIGLLCYLYHNFTWFIDELGYLDSIREVIGDFLCINFGGFGVSLLGFFSGLYLFMKSSMQKKIYKATGNIE